MHKKLYSEFSTQFSNCIFAERAEIAKEQSSFSQEALKHTCTSPSVMWSAVRIVALAVLCLGVSTPTQARTCSRQLSDGLLRIGGLYALFIRPLNKFDKTMKMYAKLYNSSSAIYA